jgi:hypothetical protein
MAEEIGFGRAIRTGAGAQPHFPTQVETVEQALDCVQELPLDTLCIRHWRLARQALWGAVDFPLDAARLAAADQALCAALAAEGWLDEIAPA